MAWREAPAAEGAGGGESAPRRGSRWARALALVLLLLFLAAAARYAWSVGGQAREGRAAPDFTLATPAGERVALRSLRGTPVLLNFWATWCPPCREEMPALQAFADRYRGRVAVLGINQREPAGAVREFGRRFGLTYPLLLDAQGAVGERYRVRALPESWLLDAGGAARVHRPGALRFEDMQAMYRRATGRSLDAGGVGPVRPDGAARALALSGGKLLVATTDGVFAAAPGAALSAPQAWTHLGPEAPAYSLYVERDAGAGGGGRLLAATDDGLLARRLQAGGAPAAGGWVRAGLRGRPVRGVAVHPATGRGLSWVAGAGLMTSGGGDGSWRPLRSDLDSGLPWLALLPDAGRPGRWLAGYGAGLMESTDGGRSWRRVGPERVVRGLAAVPGAAGGGARLYLATDRGVWVSDDGGLTADAMEAPARRYAGVAGGEAGAWSLAPNGDLYRLAGARWRPAGR